MVRAGEQVNMNPSQNRHQLFVAIMPKMSQYIRALKQSLCTALRGFIQKQRAWQQSALARHEACLGRESE